MNYRTRAISKLSRKVSTAATNKGKGKVVIEKWFRAKQNKTCYIHPVTGGSME